jgi:osmotically-inducible protein OsmY
MARSLRLCGRLTQLAHSRQVLLDFLRRNTICQALSLRVVVALPAPRTAEVEGFTIDGDQTHGRRAMITWVGIAMRRRAMKDSLLRDNVVAELEFEPSIDANDIGVAVEDGIVTLSGHVPTYGQKLAVEEAVARVKGVRGYAEHLEVRLPGGKGTADDEIARRVVDTLRWNTMVPDNRVMVKVQDGWVTLTGKLKWAYQRAGATSAIQYLKGVTGVTNIIELTEAPSVPDIRKQIEDALKRSAEAEATSLQVDVDGDKVVLNGYVKAWSERSLVARAAWSTPGVRIVEDKLIVR